MSINSKQYHGRAINQQWLPGYWINDDVSAYAMIGYAFPEGSMLEDMQRAVAISDYFIGKIMRSAKK